MAAGVLIMVGALGGALLLACVVTALVLACRTYRKRRQSGGASSIDLNKSPSRRPSETSVKHPSQNSQSKSTNGPSLSHVGSQNGQARSPTAEIAEEDDVYVEIDSLKRFPPDEDGRSGPSASMSFGRGAGHSEGLNSNDSHAMKTPRLFATSAAAAFESHGASQPASNDESSSLRTGASNLHARASKSKLDPMSKCSAQSSADDSSGMLMVPTLLKDLSSGEDSHIEPKHRGRKKSAAPPSSRDKKSKSKHSGRHSQSHRSQSRLDDGASTRRSGRSSSVRSYDRTKRSDVGASMLGPFPSQTFQHGTAMGHLQSSLMSGANPASTLEMFSQAERSMQQVLTQQMNGHMQLMSQKAYLQQIAALTPQPPPQPYVNVVHVQPAAFPVSYPMSGGGSVMGPHSNMHSYQYPTVLSDGRINAPMMTSVGYHPMISSMDRMNHGHMQIANPHALHSVPALPTRAANQGGSWPENSNNRIAGHAHEAAAPGPAAPVQARDAAIQMSGSPRSSWPSGMEGREHTAPGIDPARSMISELASELSRTRSAGAGQSPAASGSALELDGDAAPTAGSLFAGGGASSMSKAPPTVPRLDLSAAMIGRSHTQEPGSSAAAPLDEVSQREHRSAALSSTRGAAPVRMLLSPRGAPPVKQQFGADAFSSDDDSSLMSDDAESSTSMFMSHLAHDTVNSLPPVSQGHSAPFLRGLDAHAEHSQGFDDMVGPFSSLHLGYNNANLFLHPLDSAKEDAKDDSFFSTAAKERETLYA